MSQQTGGYPPSPVPGAPAGPPTTQVARDEAGEVGRTAADAGRQVAGTATEQAANVAQEVKTQARDLVGEARGQVQEQARVGQQKAADGIRRLVRELWEMADGAQQAGPVTEVARQAADRADRFADWLDERQPGDLVEEVRAFARRSPGVFLLGAAVAGAVVGRLTRGAVDAARADAAATAHRAYGEPGYLGAGAAPLPYDRRTGLGVSPDVRPPAGPPPVGPPFAGSPPAGPRPGAGFDTPPPPQGYASGQPYTERPSVPPVSTPLPPAPAELDRDLFTAPAGPAGTHATHEFSEPGDEYMDELGTGAESLGAGRDEGTGDRFPTERRDVP